VRPSLGEAFERFLKKWDRLWGAADRSPLRFFDSDRRLEPFFVQRRAFRRHETGCCEPQPLPSGRRTKPRFGGAFDCVLAISSARLFPSIRRREELGSSRRAGIDEQVVGNPTLPSPLAQQSSGVDRLCFPWRREYRSTTKQSRQRDAHRASRRKSAATSTISLDAPLFRSSGDPRFRLIRVRALHAAMRT